MSLIVSGQGSDAFGILARTYGTNSSIDVWNSGDVLATNSDGSSSGIEAYTGGSESHIDIWNSGDMWLNTGAAWGIRAGTAGGESRIDIRNSGDMSLTTSGYARGILALAGGPLNLSNSGDMRLTGSYLNFSPAAGIFAHTFDDDAPLNIANSGDLWARTEGYFSRAAGIEAETLRTNSPIDIDNSGDQWVETTGDNSPAFGIAASTQNTNSPIDIHNTGDMWVKTEGGYSPILGIAAYTSDADSRIGIWNSGDMWVETTGLESFAFGIRAKVGEFGLPTANSPIDIHNSGDMSLILSGQSSDGTGISAQTYGTNNSIDVWNSGDMRATTSLSRGILAYTRGSESHIDIRNSGDMWLTDSSRGISAIAYGPLNISNSGDIWLTNSFVGAPVAIFADTFSYDAPLNIRNSGDLRMRMMEGEFSRTGGIQAETLRPNSPVAIWNSGEMWVEGDNSYAFGIGARTSYADSRIDIDNSGDMWVKATGEPTGHSYSARGIYADTEGSNSPIAIWNSGDMWLKTEGDYLYAFGIDASTVGTDSRIDIDNSGDMWLETEGDTSPAFGIAAATQDTNGPIDIHNTGDMWLKTEGDYYSLARGIYGFTTGEDSPIAIDNSGDIWIETTGILALSRGIYARTEGADSRIDIDNSGDMRVTTTGESGYANGIYARTTDGNSPIAIDNSGDLWLKTEGESSRARAIDAYTGEADSPITIRNSGDLLVKTKGDAYAFGVYMRTQGDNNDVEIWNSDLIASEAKSASTATGILITGTTPNTGSTKITNDSGIIWAGWWNGDALNRGNAINLAGVPAIFIFPAPAPVLTELKGNDGPGHVFGDSMVTDDDRIEVTHGKTFFDGVVMDDSDADGNSLDIFDRGNLVLCQEGWTGACDPGGWDKEGFDPQTLMNGPSHVLIDDFTVRSDGTITYQFTSNSAAGDYPQVTAGTANLSGTINAVYLPAFYADETTYDDVIAADTRNGTFDQVTDNSVLLETNAIYDGSTVDLMATRNAFDEVVAKPTTNQGSVASAIENVYGKLPGPGVDPATQGPFAQLVADMFTIGDVGDYRLVLDQLSGAQYPQYLQSVLWSLRALDQSITDRMDCSLNVTGRPAVTSDRFAAAGPDGCFTPHRWQTWVRASGGWNDNDGGVNAPGYSESQFGIWAGADYAIDSRWFVGAAAGYFASDIDFDTWGGVSGGTIDYDGGQIALYGGFDNAVWYNRAIAKFGWYDGDSHRNFGLAGPVDPSGNPDADVVDFYNELGHRFALGASSMLTPYFGITVAHAEMDGFTEKDPYGTGAALKVAGTNADSIATVVGLRYNGNFGAFKPQVAVAWEHEFEDTLETVDMSFGSAPAGSNFKAIGTKLGEDSLLVEAGAAYALTDSGDVSVRYAGRWLSGYDAQSIMGRFTYKF